MGKQRTNQPRRKKKKKGDLLLTLALIAAIAVFCFAAYNPVSYTHLDVYKRQLDIQLGDHVVLVGAGYMGLQTLQVLTKGSQAGRITVFELRDDRRRMAEAMNPTEVADPESEEGKKLIEDIIKAGGADVVIDFGAVSYTHLDVYKRQMCR